MERWVGLIGLIILLLMAWVFGQNRRAIPWKMVGIGLGLQWVLALLVLGIPALEIAGPLAFLFAAANRVILAILDYTLEGSRFIFGPLVDSDKVGGFIFAVQVLPTIIFVSALMAVAYHWGLMQRIVRIMALIMQKTMGTSGAESLSAAANIFVGQTEAPLLIRPYVEKMTQSELLAVMTGGMATVAGGVMAAYVSLLRDRIPEIAGHLLTASVMSAPAALVMAKMMLPETQKPETLGRVPTESLKSMDRNTLEAATRGASEGLQLALNVGAMLLAFIALIALANGGLRWFGELIHFAKWGASWVPHGYSQAQNVELTLPLVMGWFFAPIAWLMGVPWHDAPIAGALLGEKLVLNEFVAYLHMSQLADSLSSRSLVIMSYALCGFANFSSIAIQIGGIGAIAPSRRADLASLGVRSVVAGSLAAFMTAAIAGLLIPA